MAGIFHKPPDGPWQLLPLSTPRAILRLDPPGLEPAGPDALPDGAACLLVHVEELKGWAALLAADNAIRHNGMPVAAGLRMLEHRDALALRGAAPVLFTTEEPPRIEACDATAPVSCARCRLDVAPGQPSVRCPACGVVHHQTKDRNCWTYAATCSLCPQPSALEAGLRWTPEAL